MPTPATSLAALAALDAKAALSRCASVWAWLGVTGVDDAAKAAAALPLIFIGDADDELPPCYIVLIATPRPGERIAIDTVKRVFSIEAECCATEINPAENAADDLIVGYNLDEVAVELLEQHEDGLLNFELVEVASTAVPYRESQETDRAGSILQLISFELEGWD